MSLNGFHKGITRRALIRSAACSVLGVSASGWLPRLAAAAAGKTNMSCIVLWMSGGPSQMETLDPKPGHDNGGPTKAIATAVPGIHIAENLPGVAKQMKDLAIIRGMKTREGDHGRATELMTTGRRPGTGGIEFPSLGSTIAHRMIRQDVDLPPFVSVAPPRFGQTGAGFLGPKYSPLVVSGRSNDPNARANLTIENLRPADNSVVTLDERFQLLKMLQSKFVHEDLSAEAHVANYNSAMRMIKTKGGGAFELDKESDQLRDRYGRNRFGQGCLLARRLVERGVPFVEVGLSDVPGAGAFSWDSHSDNFNQVSQLCEVLDPAWSALMEDLRDRGMLETTMVVWMGEFGRTPAINDNGGRDHFPDAWSVALGGGKIQGGQVVGNSGKDGMQANDRPTSAPDLFATILAGLGIDPHGENYDGDRPIPLVEEGGRKVEALFA